MARILTCGFEGGVLPPYFTTTSTAPTITNSKARTGSYSMYFPRLEFQYVDTSVNAIASLYVGFGFYCSSINEAPAGIFSVVNGTTYLGTLNYVRTSGEFEWRRGDCYSTFLVSTSGAMAYSEQWHRIEVYFYLHDTTGVVTIKVNGVQRATFTGDTNPSAVSTVTKCRFGSIGTWSAPRYFDDIAINDTTGSVNNSWVGQGGVYPMLISGAGASTGMTPSTGSNYACVDEIPANDTDYVSSADTGAVDLYTLSAVSLPASGSVSAVCVNYRSKVTDGAANLVPVLRSESTTEHQTSKAIALGGSFSVYSVNFDVDPIDDAAWTLSKLASLQVGQRKGI